MKSTSDEERSGAGGFREFTRAEIEQPIFTRFEQQVALHPSEPAIRTERFEWTYEDLAQWVRRVASAILTQCGTERAQVALMLDQDAPMIAAVLGFSSPFSGLSGLASRHDSRNFAFWIPSVTSMERPSG